MKILFLDVDGVLNSEEWFAQKSRANELDYLGLRALNPEAVARIKRVLAKTGAAVVLSSTWRLVDDFKDEVVKAGIPLFGWTPRLNTASRAAEIRAWLETHNLDFNNKIAIIDDDVDAGSLGLHPFFVRTTWQKGIQEEHEKALIALLS